MDNDPAFYEAVTRRALGNPEDGAYRHVVSGRARICAVLAWRARRVLGKTLNALRLVKAAFTFQDGLSYAAWKIKRHRGIAIRS